MITPAIGIDHLTRIPTLRGRSDFVFVGLDAFHKENRWYQLLLSYSSNSQDTPALLTPNALFLT